MERAFAVVLACVAAGGACSSDARYRAAPISSPDPSPPIELTPLPSPDPQRPFQHAAEVSIAARDGHVVIAAINLHTDGSETLETSSLLRGVGLAVSHDFGATFEATTDPGLVAAGATDTTDPVVRASAGGTFWFSTIATNPNRGLLFRSTTKGQSWDVVENALPVADKEWLAVAADGGLVMGANGGVWSFDAAGVVRASYLGDPDWPVMGAYVDARGAYFVLERSVASWTGDPSFGLEGSLIAATPDWTPGWSVPIGPTADGGTWAIYDRQLPTDQGRQSVVEMRLFAGGDTSGQAIPISAPGVPAFMPAAAADSEGRVHVVWYESAGPRGVLMSARSVDRDLRMGFGAARVVDPNACPGQGWIAEPTQAAPDRRLREYIDLAVDGRRVHAAWTHAPTLPARIYTSHWDF